MQLATKANRRSGRPVWFYVPLMLGLAFVRPPVLLHAAPNLTAVPDAARADELAAVRKLIKEKADVNRAANDGSTALLWAAYHCNQEMTRRCLQRAPRSTGEPLRHNSAAASEPQR